MVSELGSFKNFLAFHMSTQGEGSRWCILAQKKGRKCSAHIASTVWSLVLKVTVAFMDFPSKLYDPLLTDIQLSKYVVKLYSLRWDKTWLVISYHSYQFSIFPTAKKRVHPLFIRKFYGAAFIRRYKFILIKYVMYNYL